MKEPPIVSKHGPLMPRKPAGRTMWTSWGGLLDNRPAILAVLFLVTGFLGIPLLWLSDSFSSTEKIVWSIVVTLYTLMLIGATVAMCWWAYAQVSQLL